jgi:hypothetical protein
MNPSDVATVLAFAAAYDQRTIGEADVAAWHEALDCPWVPNISLDEAREAVIAHYRRTSERIAPADVIKHARDARATVLAPPPGRSQGAPPVWEYLAARADVKAARADRQALRERILRCPAAARRLTEPPLDYASPGQWNGYIPPGTFGGGQNRAHQRLALVRLVDDLERLEAGEDARIREDS